MKPLILASGSASRALVLQQAGVAFEQVRPPLDEEAEKYQLRQAGMDGAAQALALSEAKARSVSARLPDAIVLGCDQMLLAGDEVFDKPADHAAARAQLQRLRGRTHELLTGAVLVRGERVLWRWLERPRLTMRPFSDAFLDSYLAAAGPKVCASVGGYQIENLGAQLFEQIEGDWFSILGLPLLPLLVELRGLEVLAT